MSKVLNVLKKLPINYKRVVISSVLGVILTMILYAIIALVVFIGVTNAVAVKVFNIIIMSVISILIGYITSRNCSSFGVVNGGVTGLFYYILMTVIGLFFTKGFKFTAFFFQLMLAVVIIAMIGGIFGINKKKTARKRK